MYLLLHKTSREYFRIAEQKTLKIRLLCAESSFVKNTGSASLFNHLTN